MKLTIIADIEAASLDDFNYDTLNDVANLVRRTAHAIESSDPKMMPEGGSVLNYSGKVIGAWSLE